ncbi:MAG: hypothetical protein KHY27_11865, partial [Butyricicoccus pullicaecorum]|nr:hypothetical protein [Butyricicoccus pullicaecorum]
IPIAPPIITLMLMARNRHNCRIKYATMDSKNMYVRTASGDTLELAETDFYEYFLSKMPILPLAFERNQVIVRSGLLTGFSPRPYNIFWTPNEWRLG